MVATTLSAGDIAIIGYNSDDPDTFSFVALKPIGAGTVIRFTDQSWNGTAFAVSGVDSTITFTAAADIAAGTVIASISPQFSGSFNLDTAGDTIFAYQGAVNSPTTFLYAIEFADGNTTFNGSLAGTGLTVGTTAVGIAQDNAYFGGPTTGIEATLLPKISSAAEWIGSDTVRQAAESGPLLPPDIQIWTSNTGGAGGSLSRFDVNGTTASSLATFFANNNFPQSTAHPGEIKFDTVHDKVFIVDSGGGSGYQILEGSISQILSNPGGTPTFTILASGVDSNANDIRDIQIDSDNHFVYFLSDQTFERVAYNPNGASAANQSPTVIADLSGALINVGFEFDLDLASGTAYFVDSEFQTVFNPNPPPTLITAATENAIYRVDTLAPGATITRLNFDPEDTTGNTPPEAFPTDNGTLSDVVVDNRGTATTADDRLIFTTQSVSGGPAGVFAYDLVGNPTGAWTTLWAQPSAGALDAPDNPIAEITVDPINNQYFITIQNSLNNGTAGVYLGSLSGGTPTLLQAINGTVGGAAEATGITLDHQPTLSLTQFGSTPTYTEQPGSPSAAGAPIGLIASALASDPDNPTAPDELRGATVAITAGFLAGASHQDFLEINGATSGTLDGGKISFSYSSSTGVMTLSGVDSFAQYQSALALVTFTNSGDDPTNFGNAANLTRTISWTVSDGLISSDGQTSTINIVAVNDAPVADVTQASFNAVEQVDLSLKGNLTVSDVDGNAGETVTLSVTEGILNVTAGGSGAIVSNSGTNSVTITGTIAQINALLNTDATSAVVYNDNTDTPSANATLTLSINDNGNTGTGGALAASDTAIINVTAVNDAPDAVITQATYSATEQTTLDLKNSGLSVSDADSLGANETATLSVTEGILNVDAGGSGASVFNSGTGSVTISGSIAQINALLNTDGTSTVSYFDNTDTPTGVVGLSLTIDDNGNTGGGALSSTANASIQVIAVDDAPVNNVPGAQQSQPNTDHVIPGLSISDVDAASGILTTQLSVLHGTLVVASAGGAAVTGSGTGSVLLTGTVAQINTTLGALNNVVYHSNPSFNGNDALTVHTDDGGNTGTGGPLSDTDTVAINLSHTLPLVPQGDGHFDPAHSAGRLLRHDDGTYRIDNIDAGQLTSHTVGAVGTEWNFLDVGDFNHDGTSDILSQRFSDHLLLVHSIINDQVVGASFLGAIGGDWSFHGVGDFNHDGTSDLLWQHDTDGQLLIHTIQNNQVTGASFLGAIGTDWKFLGVGDFNNDGTSDLLWQHSTDGMLLVHDIQNNQVSGAAFLGAVGSNWHFAGVGDFNGDHTDDFLMQDENGTVRVYDMVNNQVTNSQVLETLPQDAFIAGVADYTSDGTTDLAIRHDNGVYELHQIQNNVVAAMTPIAGQVPPEWHVL